ncbi:hypothetical protein FHS57_002182 [Runella defluvii]|uniref:HNH endonuclease n=1 Tax=Runella defluvii TaxID=370973 RepID=A0A7W5ZJ16_9BACT|nr:hypothetical protein [Runella defluvii]MBB3838177.1 hypothetical protein [Runella defluvii]
MLFPLKYVAHTVENLHSYVEHTILEVCCKPNGSFSVDKLHPNFQAIVEEVAQNDNDYLKKPIKVIYNICKKLDASQLQKLRDAFTANNAIEELCKGETSPVLYDDINKIDKRLSSILKQWGKDLYNHVLILTSYSSRNGELKDYYKEFMRQNSKGICPFCGLNDLKSDLLSKRDAYDHFLPKDKYPFNTVNFHNLIPICNTCNSSYKGAKDPINKGTNRAFYPFSTTNPIFEITIKITSLDFNNPKNNIVDIGFASTQPSEVDAWRATYGIDERYNDKCRSDDAQYWIDQVLELKNYGFDILEYFPTYIANRKRMPHLEKNFLRIPFLEECMTIGIF